MSAEMRILEGLFLTMSLNHIVRGNPNPLDVEFKSIRSDGDAIVTDGAGIISARGLSATENPLIQGPIPGQVICQTLQVLQSPSEGKVLTSDGTGNATWQAPAGGYAGPIVSSGNGGDPDGTSTTHFVAMGLGLNWGFDYTPTKTGIVQVLFYADAYSADTSGSHFLLYYGTGIPPDNGFDFKDDIAPFGQMITLGASPAAPVSFNLNTFLQLTVGTNYWFDLGVFSFTGGVSGVTQTNWQIIEF